MLELKFEALTCWLNDEELGRFCRAYQVVVPGFRVERAPRHLQIAALNRDTSNAHYYRYHLARGWQQRHPDLWKEIEEYVAEKLDKDPELNPAPWLIDLGRRHGTTKALLTTVFYSEMLVGLYECFFNDNTWGEVADAWHDQNLAERDAYLARQAAEAAAPSAAPGLVATPGAETAAAQMAPASAVTAAHVEPGRILAAEVRRLQAVAKQLAHEKKGMARELAEAEARRERAEQERERLLALWDDLTRRQEWPHPVERTRRLLQALLAAWGESGEAATP